MLKMKLYLAIITLFIILLSLSFIITSCPVTNIERTSAPQIDRAYISDRDYDGRIDAVNITFNRKINDSSFVLSKWRFDGTDDKYLATAFNTGDNVDDRKVILYYDTDDLTIDTSFSGARLQFLGGDTVKDLTGIKYSQYLPKIHNIKEIDRASPVIKHALFYDTSSDSSANRGVSENDIIDIVFSDKIGFLDGAENYNSLIQVISGNFGTGAIYSLNNGNIRVKLGTSPSLVVIGTYGIDGSSSGINLNNLIVTTQSIKDYYDNPAAKRNGTGYTPDGADIMESSNPTIVKAELRDLNNNGRIDAVCLTFSEAVTDSTFVPSKWTLGLIKRQGSGLDTSGDANDKYMRVLFSTNDLTADTSLYTASIVFNDGDSIEDLFGNKLPAFENVSETDKAGPAIISADATDDVIKIAGIDNGDKVTIQFSERTNRPSVNSTNIDDILELNNGHSWLDGSSSINRATWSITVVKGITVDVLTVYLSTATTLPTVAAGDTISINTSTNEYYHIKDSIGNKAITTYTISGGFDP